MPVKVKVWGAHVPEHGILLALARCDDFFVVIFATVFIKQFLNVERNNGLE